MIDDGGTDIKKPGALWRQSVARVSGSPPHPRFRHVGDPNRPPPHTFGEIFHNFALWTGPLGPYYSSGLVEANHVFFATQQKPWKAGTNGPFTGLKGIAFSQDRGQQWRFPNKPFPAPLGNLNWVVRGRGGFYPDGWVYAIATEREFNATRLVLGRSRPTIASITDPARWQWLSGWTLNNGEPWPVFSSSFGDATQILYWSSHITYPQMVFDAPLHRYLLTFSYSYASTPPSMWKNGMELVILEAPHPWGPFSFVAHEPEFGPSNGYAPGFPIKWISHTGLDLWLKWSANFNGCAARLNCSGSYGFNYGRLHLTVARRR
jgi:hypothetical protein